MNIILKVNVTKNKPMTILVIFAITVKSFCGQGQNIDTSTRQ